MKLEKAIENSKQGVAMLTLEPTNTTIIIYFANKSDISGFRFNNLVYKNGNLAERGDVSKRNAPIKNPNWQPL